MAGMELDEAVERDDRVVVLVRLVVGEGGHDLRLGRPHRIGMLAVDLLELLGGELVFLAAEVIERAVVEHLDRLLGVGFVLRAAEPAAAGQRRRRDSQRQCGGARGEQP